MIGTRLFQVSRLSPQRQKVCLARRPGSAASALPARDCQAAPSRGAWGSHHVQNSRVLKHLPSSRLTTPPITSAANTVNVKPRACKTGLRQSQGWWRLVTRRPARRSGYGRSPALSSQETSFTLNLKSDFFVAGLSRVALRRLLYLQQAGATLGCGCGLLSAVVSLASESGFQALQLQRVRLAGSRAQARSQWLMGLAVPQHLESSIRPVSPALAGGFSPAVPPGKSFSSEFLKPFSAAPKACSLGRDKPGWEQGGGGSAPSPHVSDCDSLGSPRCLSEPQFPPLHTADRVSQGEG